MSRLRELAGPLVPWDAAEWVLRLALAGIFFYASGDKIMHPKDFAVIVKAYHMLPDPLANLAALWLPWVEVMTGVCLFTGLWRDGALALTTAMFSAFWIALIVNYFRGIDVACGCFTTDASEKAPMLWYIGRDALLLALALLTIEARRRAGGTADGQAA